MNIGSGELLLEGLDKFNVVVMPDLFIDRIAKLSSFENLLKEFKQKAESGGGSIRGIEQVQIRGGNASNVAYALGKLGVSVNFVAVADQYSEPFLRSAFSSLPNVEIDIIEGRPGYTVALEFLYNGRLVNIMLNDEGDIENAGPDLIPSNWWKRLSKTDLVGIFNWGSNMKGSELAKEVFSYGSGKGVATYFAPADLSERKEEVPSLFNNIRGILSVLSINENEARIIAKALMVESLPISYRPEEITRSAKALSKEIGASIDIHTRHGSASSCDGKTFFEKSFKVRQNIATGAGDVWDAFNMTGYLLGLEPDMRLKLANAAAAQYISGGEIEAPSMEQVASFLENSKV